MIRMESGEKMARRHSSQMKKSSEAESGGKREFSLPSKNSPFIVLAALRRNHFSPTSHRFFNFSFIWSNFVLSFYEFFFYFCSALMLVICLPLCVHVTNREKLKYLPTPAAFSVFISQKGKEKCTHWQKNWKHSTPSARPHHFPSLFPFHNEK